MPWEKDGYLATNSLIATVLILRRAIFGERDNNSFLKGLFLEAKLRSYRENWGRNSILSSMGGHNFIVLHDPMTKSFAIELESKLSESAVAKVETADYRQFAHGRHLQLAAETDSIAVIAAYSKEAEPLAAATIALIPSNVLVFQLKVPGEEPEDLVVAGLVMATLLTEAIANVAGKDPGQPEVPRFGRDIYSLNSEAYYQGPVFFENRYRLAAHRKLDNLHVSEEEIETAISAARAYESKLESATYKAVISDFDGTLCNAEQRYIGMCSNTARRIIELIEEGIVFCIASGRGGSLRDVLVNAFPPEYHNAIWIGYYGGSLIQPLSADVEHPTPNQEFNRLINWLKTTIYRPRINNFSELVRGGQLTIKVSSPEESRRLRLTIRTWLNAEGLASWRVFCSGHSIDILDDSTTKNNVVSFIENKFCINGLTQILRLGDSGDEEGNDYELLNVGLSLSADRVSTSLVSCWNYANAGSSQARATRQYLDCFSKTIDGFHLNLKPLQEEGV
jgi:hydroxymethylpyrimidine pyrophosphatase-like HAD family hydrolase